MTAEIIIALIIITTILVILLSNRGCPCGCKCCDDVCRCGCGVCGKFGRPVVYMELTGPYQLPEEPKVGAKIIAGVEAQPAIDPSRISHVGKVRPLTPRVLLYTEPLYSQSGEGESINVMPESSSEMYADNAMKETFVSHINNVRKIYFHYTNWCGFCKRMKPIWAEVKDALKDTEMEFYEIDEDIAKTPGVNGYPTILMIDEHGYRQQYPGEIDFEKLRNWCVSPSTNQIVH